MLVWLVFVLRNPMTLPFRKISVLVDHEPSQIRVLSKTVEAHLHGGFFSLKTGELQRALLGFPWVANVSLRRLWPDQLIIDVETEKPLARWGAEQLLTARGKLFSAEGIIVTQELPLLDGPDGSQKELLNIYQQITSLLSPINAEISILQLDKRHAWRMVLNHRIEVMLGRSDRAVREARLRRFIVFYSQVIRGHEETVERIDLRYPNGLVVQWKGQPQLLSATSEQVKTKNVKIR